MPWDEIPDRWPRNWRRISVGRPGYLSKCVSHLSKRQRGLERAANSAAGYIRVSSGVVASSVCLSAGSSARIKRTRSSLSGSENPGMQALRLSSGGALTVTIPSVFPAVKIRSNSAAQARLKLSGNSAEKGAGSGPRCKAARCAVQKGGPSECAINVSNRHAKILAESGG